MDFNQEAELNHISFRQGINKFSDLTYEEFLIKHTGFNATVDDDDNQGTEIDSNEHEMEFAHQAHGLNFIQFGFFLCYIS